jgi:hypothetical protein
MVSMSNDFEKHLFELKQARVEEKYLLEHMCVNLELINTHNHLVDWAQEYILILTKLEDARKYLNNLELQKTVAERYLMSSFDVCEVENEEDKNQKDQ